VQSHTDVQAHLGRRQRMEPESYNGYPIWGHAISQQGGYAASGTITTGTKLVEGSGVLATCTTEEEARLIGLDWAKAWADTHG
jgi:hypothetical protein